MTELKELQDTLKTEVAGIKDFVLEREAASAAIQKEELSRIETLVLNLQEQQRQTQRAALQASSSYQSGVIQEGKYRGLDDLDLRIMASLIKSEQARKITDPDKIANLAKWHTSVVDAQKLHLAAALDSVTAASGDELVPTLQANRLWMDVNLTTPLLGQMEVVDMPSNPFDVPIQLGNINFYPGNENIAATSTAPTTAKVAMTAYELVGHVPWSYDIDEDAVIAMLPSLRAAIVRNVSETIEDVLLNADTTTASGINSDGATITTSDAGKAQWLLGFDGLRHAALVDNTAMGNNHAAVPSADMFNEARRAMGKYGVNSNFANRRVVHVGEIVTWIKSQTITALQTIDKYGPAATILNGELGNVEGIPFIVSAMMRQADTDGKVTDAGNGTNTGALLTVNLGMWRAGFRRELLIETDQDIVKRQHDMVASFRIALQEQTGSKSTQTHTHLQYNIDIT